jgi:FixJ family two-component response regulator
MTQTAIKDHLIYVVDDDHSISKLVSFNLTARGYQVRQFDNGHAVLDGLAADGSALIIMDYLMPGANGLEVTRKVR